MLKKPSKNEEEYMVRMEFERKRKIEEDRQKSMAASEKQHLLKEHFMCCPKCGMKLIEIDYKHIKIDECSACKGVWLDAGELDQVSSLSQSNLKKLFSIFE